MKGTEPCTYRRKTLDVTHFPQFKLSEKSFNQQFANIYLARLAELKEHVSRKAKAKWGEIEIVTLSMLPDQSENETYIIIGTLYKHQELKPSILKELSEELQLVTQPQRQNYASFKDVLFLEDEALRVRLAFDNVNLQSLITGLVCALLGRPLDNGIFLVMDYCFPGCPPQLTTGPTNEEEKILLISGLDITNVPESLSLNLLSEWITGMVGDQDSQKEQASISCVIIAGNSLRGSIETYNHKGYFDTKAHTEAKLREAAISAHRLDSFVHSIVQSCPVILMPGEFDPVCHTLPQQPFHPCSLPCSSRLKSLNGATNPWIGKINSRIIAGSSGQPIQDIMKVAGLTNISALSWLEYTLAWRHFAPTAPDTLPAYPYFDTDPFIIKDCPDIYFAGNMEKYESKLLTENGQTVRLICVPAFWKTHTGVLINLYDLNTWPISFGHYRN